jgi:hypothetical protein
MLAVAVPLAKSGEAAKAGPIGLVVIVLLCVACYFLFKSMSKHLRRVRENFPDDSTGAGDGAGAPPAQHPVPDRTDPAGEEGP